MPFVDIRRLLAPLVLTIGFVAAPAVRFVMADEQRPSIVFAAREIATAPQPAAWPGTDGRVSQNAIPRAIDARKADFDVARLISRAPFTQIGFVLLFAGLALGVLWMVFSGRQLDSEVESTSAAGQATKPDDAALLTALIGNTLAVVEEPVLFPALAQIHGRPVVNVRYRVEAAHAIAGPHFAETTTGLPCEESANRFRVTAARVDRPSNATRGPSTLDRVLAAVDGGLS